MTDEERTEEQTTEEEATAEEKQEQPKGLTEEDINKLIEKARKEEKDKLYGSIDDLKGNVKTLEDKIKADEEVKEKLKAEADAKAEKSRLKNLSIEEKLTEQLNTIEEQLHQSHERQDKLEREARESAEKQELEAYKAQILKDAGDEIITDLVRGNSKEEIDTNTAIAKSRFQEIFQAAKEKAEGKKREVGGQMPGPTDPDPAPIEEEELRGIIKPNMSPEEYEENREKILGQVEDIYKRMAQGS